MQYIIIMNGFQPDLQPSLSSNKILIFGCSMVASADMTVNSTIQYLWDFSRKVPNLLSLIWKKYQFSRRRIAREFGGMLTRIFLIFLCCMIVSEKFCIHDCKLNNPVLYEVFKRKILSLWLSIWEKHSLFQQVYC